MKKLLLTLFPKTCRQIIADDDRKHFLKLSMNDQTIRETNFANLKAEHLADAWNTTSVKLVGKLSAIAIAIDGEAEFETQNKHQQYEN